MIGVSSIPELRLTRLQKLIERFTKPVNLTLTNLFGSFRWDSDNIEWETQIGNRGLTPLTDEDAPAPRVAPLGVGHSSAMAAFWKEKMHLSSSVLNNLREPGTTAKYMTAARRLARETKMLRNRCDRRKEWMFAKMLSSGSFNYVGPSSVKYSVDYNIPAANKITLAANRHWDTGANRNIVEDIMDTKLIMSNLNGADLSWAVMTQEILNMMTKDASIQTILAKSAFGSGDLFANPKKVLANLLNIDNFVIYDQQYQVRAWLTGAVTADTTVVISVDDTTDFEVGGTLTFADSSARTTEAETIASIDHNASTITVSTAPSTSYKVSEDYVYMTRKFIPIDKFIMFAPTVEDQLIAEFAEAPFALNRTWGLEVDQWEVKDPDGIYLRVQNKGIPVLYQEDGIIILTVT